MKKKKATKCTILSRSRYFALSLFLFRKGYSLRGRLLFNGKAAKGMSVRDEGKDEVARWKWWKVSRLRVTRERDKRKYGSFGSVSSLIEKTRPSPPRPAGHIT
jgi:hypothetical protein